MIGCDEFCCCFPLWRLSSFFSKKNFSQQQTDEISYQKQRWEGENRYHCLASWMKFRWTVMNRYLSNDIVINLLNWMTSSSCFPFGSIIKRVNFDIRTQLFLRLIHYELVLVHNHCIQLNRMRANFYLLILVIKMGLKERFVLREKLPSFSVLWVFFQVKRFLTWYRSNKVPISCFIDCTATLLLERFYHCSQCDYLLFLNWFNAVVGRICFAGPF